MGDARKRRFKMTPKILACTAEQTLVPISQGELRKSSVWRYKSEVLFQSVKFEIPVGN